MIDIKSVALDVRHQNKSDEVERAITTLWCSFESGYQCANVVYFPERVKIMGIKGIVIKALSATNSGTITGANSTGNSANGVLTFAASAPLGNQQSATPTTNIIVEPNSYYAMVSQKTTVGGVVLVTIQYARIN